jgi:hypothetical protein
MRRGFFSLFPVGIAIAVGLIVLVHQFISNIFLDELGSVLIAWSAIIAAFAVLLGLLNVLSVHVRRLIHHDGNVMSSVVILISAFVVFLVVLPSGGASPASAWVFRYLYQPLEASFLALLVFFIASAAYRALRARSWETSLLVIATLVVLIGSAPIANLISPLLPAAKDWVMNVPAVAGVRGILFGVALGIIATGLRLLSGIDRPYTE